MTLVSDSMFHDQPFLTDEERRSVASLPHGERQILIERLLYKYPGFKTGEAFVKEHNYPVVGSDRHGRGVLGGLLGRSRTGKSMICRYYAESIRPEITEHGESYPIVYIPASTEMTPTTAAERIFHETGARAIPRVSGPSMIRQAVLRLQRMGTKFVIIDDAQFLFFQRHRNHETQFQSLIKQMLDLVAFNVLLVGDVELRKYVRGVPYLEGRGGFPYYELKPLPDDEEGIEHTRLLLDGIDSRLPFLSRSDLGRAEWAYDFHRYSDGVLGLMMNLIRRAAYRAMSQGTGCILREHLHEEVWKELPLGAKNDYFLGDP